jgi:phage terminase large subunit
MLFPRLWIDESKCGIGLEALARYRRGYNKLMGEFKATPVHDASSHAADALRYCAVSHKSAVLNVSRPPCGRVRLRLGLDGGLIAG